AYLHPVPLARELIILGGNKIPQTKLACSLAKQAFSTSVGKKHVRKFANRANTPFRGSTMAGDKDGGSQTSTLQADDQHRVQTIARSTMSKSFGDHRVEWTLLCASWFFLEFLFMLGGITSLILELTGFIQGVRLFPFSLALVVAVAGFLMH